jgi:hypothetical protein
MKECLMAQEKKMALPVGCALDDLGIPQDIVDKGHQLGMDAKELVKLCVKHSVEAARDFLNAWAAKLPSFGSKPPA